MNHASDPLHEGHLGSIRRRHIIYVEAYDPRGVEGYYRFFHRTCEHFQRLWPFSLALQPFQIDSPEFGHWLLNVRGRDWEVATRYDFLRLDGFIKADISGSTPRQVVRAVSWLLADLLSGAHFRIMRSSWRFGLQNLSLQCVLLAWLVIAGAIAVAAGWTAMHYIDWAPVGLGSSVVAAFAFLGLSRPIIDRSYALQICNAWAPLRKFARGRPSWLDPLIDAGAQRVIAVVQANEVDELAVIGHSSGCVIALAIMARAMEIKPDLGRSDPRLVLLTLGSMMPGVALRPAARRLREIVRRLALEPAIAWIDCWSPLDPLCFAYVDPVDGIGVHVGNRRCNPVPWHVSFAEMISPDDYRHFRSNFFRTHFQYIMGGDRQADYDYALLVGGPLPIAEWPKRYRDISAAFRRNAASNTEGCAAID